MFVSMKIRAISPLYPSIVVNITEHLDNIIDFVDIWCMFCRSRKPSTSELEVELCESSVFRSKFFDLNTTLASVLKDCNKESVLFSFDFKRAINQTPFHVEINYIIASLQDENNCGKVILNETTFPTLENVIDYITLRHSLMYDINMKTQGVDYVALQPPSDYYVNIKDPETCYGKIPLSNLQIKYLPQSTSLQRIVDALVLLNEVTLICRKYPKDIEVKLSARDFNQSNDIQQLLKTVSGEEIYYLFRLWGDRLSVDDINTLVERKCPHPIIHVEAKEEKLKRITEFKKTAQRIITSPEWKSFLSELQSQMEDSWLFYAVFPRKCGKTQLAYNLSHHYYVVYFDCAIFHRNDYSVTDEAVRNYDELQNLIRDSLFVSHICSLLDHLISHCLSSDHYISYPRLMHFFDNFSDFKWELDRRIGFDDLKRKYSSEVFSSFLLFFDDYKKDCLFHEISLLYFITIARKLGIKVIVTHLTQTCLEFPKLDIVPCFKGRNIISAMINTFPFLLKFYKHSIDENIMLQRYMEQTVGDEGCRQYFFIFLIEQISSSVPLISEAIITVLTNMTDSVKDPVPFETWRDNCLISIVEYLTRTFSESNELLLGAKLGSSTKVTIEPGNYGCDLNESTQRNFVCKKIKEAIHYEDFLMRTYAFKFETNVFAYFYELYNRNQKYYPYRVWELEPLQDFLCYSSVTFSNTGIQRKSLSFFIEDIIKAILPESHLGNFSLQIPDCLNDIDVAFYPPFNCTWPESLSKACPDMIADWHRLKKGFRFESGTFEYFHRDERKKGRVVFDGSDKNNDDFELCIRFCSLCPYETSIIANFCEFLSKFENKLDEIEKFLHQTSSFKCDCFFPVKFCPHCNQVADYFEEVLSIGHYISLLSFPNNEVEIPVRRSNDAVDLINEVEVTKGWCIRTHDSWISERGRLCNKIIYPDDISVFTLIDEYDGKFWFKNIHNETVTEKIILVLPIIKNYE